MQNKKAQIANTVMWIIATIAIVVILFITLFVTNIIKKQKSFEVVKYNDVIGMKSLASYLLTWNSSGERIFTQISEDQNLNEFSGKIGEAIFKQFKHEGFPWGVWLGVTSKASGALQILTEGNYFGDYPSTIRGGRWGLWTGVRSVPYVSEKVKLDERINRKNSDKYVELILVYQ